MNTIQLNASIADLLALTEVSPDHFAFVGKFFKTGDGTPLGSVYIDNSNDLVSEIINPASFQVNIPVQNATFNIAGVELRLFANAANDCCFAKFNWTNLINQFTPSVSVQAVLLSGLGNAKVYRYEPSTGNLVELFDAISAPDIAHTSTKLFMPTTGFVDPDVTFRIRAYNINLSPFSQTFDQNYDMPLSNAGAGLCAVSNTLLYSAGETVNEIVISGSLATATPLFSFPATYSCTGDLIYDPTTELFLITYSNNSDARIGVFDRDGNILRSAPVPVDNMYGMYQFEGNTYVIDGDGQIYSLNLTTLVATAGTDLNTPISGASQIQSNISIPVVNPLLTGLTVYYKLNETSGNAIDSTGNRTTASQGNLTQGVGGKLGNAYTFNGTNSQINIPRFLNSNTFSISAWVKTNSATNQIIVTGSSGGGIEFRVKADGTVGLFQHAGAEVASSALTVANGAWHHVVVTFDGTAWTFYVDGVLSGTGSNATSFTFSGTNDGIGSDGGTLAFNGQLDEIGVWSRVLLSSEVTSLYNGGTGLTHPF